MSYQEKTGPLMANSHPGSYCGQDAYSDMLVTERERESMDGRKRTDASGAAPEESRSVEHDARSADSADMHYIARRLTPTECARLQGFPPDWCSGLGIEKPTEEELAFFEKVFETHRQTVTHAKKPVSRWKIKRWLKNPYNDSSEYKLWGNGIALPCLFNLFKAIVDVYETEAEEHEEPRLQSDTILTEEVRDATD